MNATKEMQAWCCLQVKLCDPCLSALCVPWCKRALYKYSSFPFLFVCQVSDSSICHCVLLQGRIQDFGKECSSGSLWDESPVLGSRGKASKSPRSQSYAATTATVLWPFSWDHPGEPVTNQCPPPPSPHFFTGRMPFLPSNQQCQSTEGNYILKVILQLLM